MRQNLDRRPATTTPRVCYAPAAEEGRLTSFTRNTRRRGDRMASGIKDHRVVPHDEWLEARKALLAKEKEFTRQRSELSRQRRELPWHCDLARAAGEDRAIQEEDGMELQVGLV